MFPYQSKLRDCSGLILFGLAGWLFAPASALAGDNEQRFASPQAAADALVVAAKTKDTNALHSIFGPEGQDLVSADVAQAGHSYSNFVRRLAQRVDFTRNSNSNVVLQIGADAWPFPIPLAQAGGKWFFDTAAGREEILNRRIGMNELAAVRVCLTYVDAQREYASLPRNGDDILEYAQRLRSATNTHDGLYWHAEPGKELSPFGPLIAQSREEGYQHGTKIMTENLAPYRGYCFKILTQQGSHAPAGKYKYLINGHLLAGFALVAWPEEWGNSGVMTFIVNQQGKVHQKDLGAKTSKLAAAMTTYDPDRYLDCHRGVEYKNMKTMTKVASAILALGASSWVIIAQQTGGRDPVVPGVPGGPLPAQTTWPGEFRSLPPVFRALDANHDGVIDADEIANAPAALKTLLKDGKTTLTLGDLLGESPMLVHGPDDPKINKLAPQPVIGGAVDLAPGRPGGPNGPGGPGGPQ